MDAKNKVAVKRKVSIRVELEALRLLRERAELERISLSNLANRILVKEAFKKVEG